MGVAVRPEVARNLYCSFILLVFAGFLSKTAMSPSLAAVYFALAQALIGAFHYFRAGPQ